VVAGALAGLEPQHVLLRPFAGLGRADADIDELGPVLEGVAHAGEYEAEWASFKD
jgi:hypothetical protein